MTKRELEKTIYTDLSRDDDYTGYLRLDQLLTEFSSSPWETRTDRDFSEVRSEDDEVIAVLKIIYENRADHWARYEMCETLMDIANNFHFWRFHHMKTVERIIGHKPGSGGTSGVSFLKKALDIEFFPDLMRVRTEIGEAG